MPSGIGTIILPTIKWLISSSLVALGLILFPGVADPQFARAIILFVALSYAQGHRQNNIIPRQTVNQLIPSGFGA